MPFDWATEATRGGVTAAAALLASFFGAKWAESRKLEARFEKLDRIREEVREVTRIQEDIKRQLQGGEWNRQTLWRQRLDAYTQLLRTSADYLDRCHSVRAMIGTDNSEMLHSASVELQRLRADTFKAVTVVEIFGDAAILDVLSSFFARMRKETAVGNSPTSVGMLTNEIGALGELQTAFVTAARNQLKGSLDQL